ncbi:MAG: SIR2 family protein [Flavobacteriales bacterium]
MTQHDPREHIRGLYQLLVSDKKRIGFLFGAGSSLGTGAANIRIPAVKEMTTLIEKELSKKVEYATAIAEITKEIGVVGYNIESLLSSIETKRQVIGKGVLNGLNAQGLEDLSKALRSQIVKLASVHETWKDEDKGQLGHLKLGGWVRKAQRRYPVEIFTTNYDYLFEVGLEAHGVQYYDGFAGTFEPFFNSEAVEDPGVLPNMTKLWKIHGSLGWKHREHDGAVIRDRSADAETMLIYPSNLKYRASKKQPYVSLIDRLCAFLQQDDSILITCGYSFGDDHINERMLTSLNRGANSQVLSFYYDEYVDGKGATKYLVEDPSTAIVKLALSAPGGKLSVFGFRHAVVGGKHGTWRLSAAPSPDEKVEIEKYFEVDPAIVSSTEEDIAGNVSTTAPPTPTGHGRLLLPYFTNMVAFLDDMTLPGL